MSNAKLLGKVDLLGLNSLGQPAGMHPLWGVLIGGGLAHVTSTAVAHTSKARYANLIGLAVGVASGGALYAMGKGTRSMGLGAIAGAFVSAGFKFLEGILFGDTPKAVAGVGLPMIQPLNGLGLPMMHALNGGGGGGFGLPSASNIVPPQGTIPGVAGPQMSGGVGNPPISLLGQHLSAGGPSISGLSAMYGATLLGSRGSR